MTRPRTLLRVLVCAVLVLGLVTAAPVTASDHTTTTDEGGDDDNDEDDEGDDAPVVDIDLGKVVDAIQDMIDALQDFTGTWDATLKDLLVAVLFKPFQVLAQQLLRAVAVVLTNTPTVHPNPAVEEVHRLTLVVTYLLAGLGFTAAGVLYMIGPILGVSYRQVRLILPRMVVALVFATVSLPLLQYAVDLSDALVWAFAPSGLTMSLTEMAGLSVSLVLVWLIQSVLLLVLVVMFIIRDVYLLFVAAISPLIALAWSLPRVKRYADTFIAGWWTALAMAPLDLLVLRFNIALLSGAGVTPVQSVSNWILGVAGFVLLILVPYQLYGASQAAVGQAYLLSRGVKQRLARHRGSNRRAEQAPDDRQRRNRHQTGDWSGRSRGDRGW